MPALATRIEWLRANAGVHQTDVTDRSVWDWYGESCSRDLPPGECRVHPRARPTQRPRGRLAQGTRGHAQALACVDMR